MSTGDYVITVQEVTSPQFMEVTLEPAFLQVRIVLPKKTKKAVKPKDKGPK